MTNAEKFIDLVGKLYNLPEKQIAQMQNNVPEIDAELGKYYWEDIERKTQLFYARKNDKSRPRVCQILALLETDSNIIKREPDPEPEQPTRKLPETGLWSIKQTFNKMISVFVDAGVIPDANGDFHNTRSIIDPKTDLPVINPIQWLKWQLSDARNEHPEVFASLPTKTFFEDLALAIENDLITFKVRDWAKLAQQKKQEA